MVAKVNYYIANTPGPGDQFFDDNGRVLSGGKIYIYYTGTSVLAPLFSDNKGTTLVNPFILDDAGRSDVVWFSDLKYHDMSIYDADGKLIKKYTGSVYGMPLNEDKPGIRDVRRYGAIGDGKQDDTLAIQNALDSLSSTDGDSIGFFGGIFIISDTLHIMDKNRINLLGFQATLKRIDKQNPTTSKPLIKLVNVKRIKWDNLHTDGNRLKNRTNPLLECPNVLLENVERVDFVESDVLNHVGYGITIAGNSKGHSKNINIEANFEGGNNDCIAIKGARNVHMDITASNVLGNIVTVEKDNLNLISRDIYLDRFHADNIKGIGYFSSMGSPLSENMYVGRGRIDDVENVDADKGIISISECDLTVENVRFSNCRGRGSAIMTFKHEDIRVKDCVFEGNSLQRGNLWMDGSDLGRHRTKQKAWVMFNRSINCDAVMTDSSNKDVGLNPLWSFANCSPFQLGNISANTDPTKRAAGTQWYRTNFGFHAANNYFLMLRFCMEEEISKNDKGYLLYGNSSTSLSNNYIDTIKTGTLAGVVNKKHDEVMGGNYCTAFNFVSIPTKDQIKDFVPFGHNADARAFFGNASTNFWKSGWKAVGLRRPAKATDWAIAELNGAGVIFPDRKDIVAPDQIYILNAIELPYLGAWEEDI